MRMGIMKKIKYINIMLVLAILFTGAVAYAEENATSDFTPGDRALMERKMVKDKIEHEKLMRLEDKNQRPAQINNFRDEPKALDALKLRKIKSDTEKRDGLSREDAMEKKEALKERMMDKQERMEERKENRAEEWKMRAAERLRAGFERLSNIIDRLESRMAKIDEAGGSTERAKALIENAKDKIELAKQKVEEIKNIESKESDEEDEMANLGQNELVREALPIAKEVQKLLKDAHQDLVNAVKYLKEDNRKDTLQAENSESSNGEGSDENEQN